jgi:hypothetical protein
LQSFAHRFMQDQGEYKLVVYLPSSFEC